MTWTEPDRVVVELAESLAPGRVLDIGAGDGHDCLWLAERGWSATAVDLSRHYVRKLNQMADERGLEVTAIKADATTLDNDSEFDLALICYIHVPPEIRRGILQSVLRALKPSGRLLWRSFEAGMPDDPGFDRDLLPTLEDVLAEIGRDMEVDHAMVADEYFPFMKRDMRLLTIIAHR